MKKAICTFTVLSFCFAVSACGSAVEQPVASSTENNVKVLIPSETITTFEIETASSSEESTDFPDDVSSNFFYDMEKVSDTFCQFTVEMTENSVILHLNAPSYNSFAFYLYKSDAPSYQKCEITEGDSPHSSTVTLPVKPNDIAELRILDSNHKDTYNAFMLERSDIIPEDKKGYIFDGFGFAPPVYVNVPDEIKDASFLYLEEEVTYHLDASESQTVAVKLVCDKATEFTGEIYQELPVSIQKSVDMDTLSWHFYSDDFVWKSLTSDIEESVSDDGEILVVKTDVTGAGTYLIMANPIENSK